MKITEKKVITQVITLDKDYPAGTEFHLFPDGDITVLVPKGREDCQRFYLTTKRIGLLDTLHSLNEPTSAPTIAKLENTLGSAPTIASTLNVLYRKTTLLELRSKRGARKYILSALGEKARIEASHHDFETDGSFRLMGEYLK